MKAQDRHSHKTALVLSGGGSRGAYQIGAWRAINELGIHYDMVVGVSVGALNGAMATQGNQVLAEELWRRVETDNVFEIEAGAQPVDYARELISKGGVSSLPLLRLVKKYAPEEAIRSSKVDFGLLTTELPTLKPHYLWKEDIPQGLMEDYIVASASVFPGVKPKRINGVDYVDGGIINVMPIHMAVERGATKVIAVYLRAVGRFDAKKELSCCDDITLIQPNFDLGNFLVFDRNNSNRLIRLGYLDTMKTFGVYDGDFYAFIKGHFDKKTLKGADAAAHMLNLDPLILYSKEYFMESLDRGIVVAQLKQEEELRNLREASDIKDLLKKNHPLIDTANLLTGIKSVLDYANREAITLLIANDLKEKGEKSLFSAPLAKRTLGEQFTAAEFIVNNNMI